jgi:hypothetical protein
VARERTAPGSMWDKSMAVNRAAWAVTNELDMVGSQVRTLGLPARAAVSGSLGRSDGRNDHT